MVQSLPLASHDPLRSLLPTLVDVTYRDVRDQSALPAASHYFFRLEGIDESTRALVLTGVRSGATVTLIVSRVEPFVLTLAEHTNVNIVPAYGDTAQITPATFKHAMTMVLAGERVVAEGFLVNSLRRIDITAGGSGHPFVEIMIEASITANTETTAATAVLALQRTGSKFLRDLIGWTVSSNVRVLHEHDVPTPRHRPGAAQPMGDQHATDYGTQPRHGCSRDGNLSDMLMTSTGRRYVFLSERHPEERLVSYFVRRRSGWLHSCFDSERHRFRNPADIQQTFHDWSRGQLARQREWYRDTLVRHFGLQVLNAKPTGRDLFVCRNGVNTLVVVPMNCLNTLRAAVSAAFGTRSYELLADNSARARGDHAIDRAFRRDFRLDPAIARALWSIPEVAHIHGESSAMERRE